MTVLSGLVTPLSSEGTQVPVVDPASGDGVFSLLWLIIALPALGAAVLLLAGDRRSKGWAHLLGCATVLVSFVIGLVAFFALLGRDEADRSVAQSTFTWFQAGDWTATLDLLFDPLSALFVLLITGVGALIHIYSIGY
ncbi:MAG TPA: hypothetical protein VFG63_08575, partial [Nocardioidaceae bacterium]|nr:hypothetical protein [Nocardioidaceae bacterium]